MRSMRNRSIFLVILVLLIGIGYASLNAKLKIDGVVNMPTSSWNVHFNNIQINNNSVTLSEGDTAATIVVDQTNKVTYKVSMHNPGDYYEFTVDAVNSGTIDAMIDTISSKLNNTEITSSNLPVYLNYSVTYADGVALGAKHRLAAGATETYKIRIEYKRDIEANQLPQGEALNLNFQVDYVQADSTAIAKPLWAIPEGRTANNLQVGDELCIRNECFNFIGYDGNNVKLLAKYNLKVGKIYDSGGTQTGTYSSGDTGYGLQSSEEKGYAEGQVRYGTVAFSATNYWYDGSNLKAKYGSAWNTNNVYDTDYVTEPDFSGNGFNTTGYSVAYYVEEYKDKLEDYGATINDARLLTYREATDSSIGCSGSSCPTNGFITNTSFWLGSAIGGYRLWVVRLDGTFRYGDNDIVGTYGVRPVIIISKSDI